MIEDMYRIFDRIKEIQERFGLNRPDTDRVPKESFQQVHDRTMDEAEIRKTGEPAPPEIKNTSPKEIQRLADFYADRNRIPKNLVKSVIEVESGYRPDAVSPKGAMGLMQLMPAVADQFGVNNPFDPTENIRAGTGLLKQLLETYNGDYKRALAAYNAGPAAVERRGGVPDYKETKDYVNRVIESYLKNK